MRELKVYNHNILAGTLTENSASDYAFRYDDNYLDNPSLPAISVTLSKRQQMHTSDHLFPFFANLLPEGANRHALCAQHKVDESDLFGMLMAVRGWDFIGDVSVR